MLALMVGAGRVLGTDVVDNARIAIDECAKDLFIAERRTIDPRIDGVLRVTLAVGSERAGKDRLAEADQAFKRQGITGRLKWEQPARASGIRGRDLKSD